ncbi:MAG: RNA pyrophosphohydrolase [Pseudomonadota bacterium]
MIDDSGYRPNVGIILCNRAGEVFWGRRRGHDGWQFPQGGIHSHETPEEALFRELHEEVGLGVDRVEMLGRTRDWLHYDLPPELRRRPPRRGRLSTGRRRDGGLRGQKQIWFLLRFTGQDADVQLDLSGRPEFDAWRWITYWQALEEIVAFKREVYRLALTELAPLAGGPTAG